ncbi:MAG: AI-2E family transporter [Candidatus Paceibacterota bacterium]|jgi:predicted PurR-regulated permease PerM
MKEKDNVSSISISNGSIIRVFLIVLGFFLIYVLRDMVLVILTSIVIASFVESAIPYFRKIRMGRVMGVAILYIVSISVLAGLFYLFAPLLITEIYNFAVFISSYAPGVDFLNYFQNDVFSGAKDIVANLSGNFSLDTLLLASKAFISNLSGGFFTTVSVAFGSIFNFVLIIIISFYLSIQEKGIENFLRIILPIKHEDYIVNLWERSSRKIGLWMKGQMLLGILVGVLIYLVLSLLGIQYALLLAIIAGIMEMVPYGILIALVPAISFSFLSGGMSSALMVGGAYLIIHQFEVFLFNPLIVKRVVGLSPLVVILSVLIGFELAGFWGIVLAIPTAVVLMEFLGDIEKDKIFSKIKNEK